MIYKKRILILAPMVVFLLSLLVKGTEETTGSGIVHYQFKFSGNRVTGIS
jgi:hypothetical protein